MARRQFLWIDPRGADCYFSASGNISTTKGTLAIWQHAMTGGVPFSAGDVFWRLPIDANNYMEQVSGRSLRVASGGVVKTSTVEDAIAVADGGHGYVWELMVYDWDFSGGDGEGVLHCYWDGVSSGSAVTDATASIGTPTGLYLGPVAGDAYCQDKAAIAGLAVWSDVMTAEQVADLYAQGHRHRIIEGDGTGTLTLMASFDGQFDADVASGGWYFHHGATADRYCLVDDGLRKQGRLTHILGTPRHDLSEDDRVPLYVTLRPFVGDGRESYLTATNDVNFSDLRVAAGYATDDAVGAAFAGLPAYQAQQIVGVSTYSQRIHVPSADNPNDKSIRIGPVDYHHAEEHGIYGSGSGLGFQVQASEANSETSFLTNIEEGDAGYWVGADLLLLNGVCAGRRLKVTGYDGAGLVTVEMSLPAIPAEYDQGIVDFRAHVLGVLGVTSLPTEYWGYPDASESMDMVLTDHYSDQLYFPALEFDCDDKGIGWLRYDRGRLAKMVGCPPEFDGQGFVYGRPKTWAFDPDLYCRVLLERVEIVGTGTYQILRQDASGNGPSYADNFMATGPDGEATKVWRKLNVTRTTDKPTKITPPSATTTDLQAEDTWRHTAGLPIPIQYDEDAEEITCLLTGVDNAGNVRWGYIVGAWDDATGRIAWTDEIPPEGKTNPLSLTIDDLRPSQESDAMATRFVAVLAVLPSADGTQWFLAYGGDQVNDDHYMSYLLGPCDDRWSFSRAEHWWDGNPVLGINGGPDLVAAYGSGAGTWVNRDADWHVVVVNPYTKDPTKRYWGWGTGKTLNNSYFTYGIAFWDRIGMCGPDLRAMTPLPHRNSLDPLAGRPQWDGAAYVYGQADCIMQYSQYGPGDDSSVAVNGIYAGVSEDGVHMNIYADTGDWITAGDPGEAASFTAASPFRLGDRTIYYYGDASFSCFAWNRVYGECWYGLDSGQTSGLLETPLIEMPADGWGALVTSCDPNGGTLAVEVLDENEVLATGYTRTDCDALADATEQAVTWGGASLEDLDVATIRLRFVFTGAGAGLPKLYQWSIGDADGPVPPTPLRLPAENGQTDGAGTVPFYVAPNGTYTLTWPDMPGIVGGQIELDVDEDGSIVEPVGGIVNVTCLVIPGPASPSRCRCYIDMLQAGANAPVGATLGKLSVVKIITNPPGDSNVYSCDEFADDTEGYTDANGRAYLDITRLMVCRVTGLWPDRKKPVEVTVTVPDATNYNLGVAFPGYVAATP